MAKNQQEMMGVYRYLDDLLDALRALKERGLKIGTVYSPARSHEILEVLEVKRSPVRYFTLVGGWLGVTAGFALSMYTAAQWKFIVSGKPAIPVIPYVIVGFELTILFSVIMNLLGALVSARLPKVKIPAHYDPRFSEDRYGVVVSCGESERDEVEQLLREAGAEEVNDVKR